MEEENKLNKKCILIDCHEPNVMVERVKKTGLLVEVQPLQSGDYVIGKVLIERKEIGDFFNSLKSGRLFDQLFKMKTTDMRSFLVIVGNYPPRRMKISKRNVEQQIKKLSLIAFMSYGVLFVRVETEEQFIEFLKWVWQRAHCETYAPVAKKPDNPIDMKLAMLTSVAGIGKKLADELASQYTLRELMDMPEEKLREYTFAGRKLGKKIDTWLKVREL